MPDPVDPDALAEAYAFYTETGDPVADGRLGQAARAFLEAPTAEMCSVHEARYHDGAPGCVFWMFAKVVEDRYGTEAPRPCKIVGRVRLVAEAQ